MACITLHPGRLAGTLSAPPSKSLAHRAIICGGLAPGESRIHPVDDSQDMRATLGCMAALGTRWRLEEGMLTVSGGGPLPPGTPRGDCLESGSTLRFMLPLALALGGGGEFLTRGRLSQRPLGPYAALFEEKGIALSQEEGAVRVSGKLAPGRFSLPGDVSSQFVTGLLLALPLLSGDSEIHLTTDPESEGYIHLTLDVLAAFGVRVEQRSRRAFFVPGGQGYRPRAYAVEGDYSQAAVMLCAGALGSGVWVKGLAPDSRQGDRAAVSLLEAMGARAQRRGDALCIKGEKLSGIAFDGGQCPDILPMMALVCALARGESRIENAGRLRLKESDRLAATLEELGRLGAHVRGEGDALCITGQERLAGGVAADCHGDHRIAMMLSIAALACRAPITLRGAECVAKSWPGYWEQYALLGGKIT